jgi:hypothetical protein
VRHRNWLRSLGGALLPAPPPAIAALLPWLALSSERALLIADGLPEVR